MCCSEEAYTEVCGIYTFQLALPVFVFVLYSQHVGESDGLGAEIPARRGVCD